MKKSYFILLSILCTGKIFTQDFYRSPSGCDDTEDLRTSYMVAPKNNSQSSFEEASFEDETSPNTLENHRHNMVDIDRQRPSLILIQDDLSSSELTDLDFIVNSSEITYKRFKAQDIISNERLTLLQKTMLLHRVGEGSVHLRNDKPLCPIFQSQYIAWNKIDNTTQLQYVKFMVFTENHLRHQKKKMQQFLIDHPQITPIYGISDSKTWRKLARKLNGSEHVVFSENKEIIYVNISWVKN